MLHTSKYEAAVVTSQKLESVVFMQKSLKMTSIEKVPKLSGKKSNFLMFAAKAKAYLAMKFLSATLSANFKESLSANDAVELDLNKPKELAKNKCKAMNLHAMNLLTVMMVKNNLML